MRAAALIIAMAAMVRAQGVAPLYESDEWFALRDAVTRDTRAPAFYRGMVEAAFHNWPRAEKDLNSVLRAGADPMQALEAGLALERMYMMSGRLREARQFMTRLDAALRKSPGSSSARLRVADARRLLDVVNGLPDQRVVLRGLSRVRFTARDGGMYLPVTANGIEASYLVDTGSEISTVNQSEAHRLGLRVRPASIPLSTFEGREEATGVALIDDLIVGNFHLRNVQVAVTKDGGGPASGILGMPVLLALETLRWNSDGTLEIGFPGEPLDLARANVCFARLRFPVAAASIAGRRVMLGLDTGSPDSEFFPRYVREFAAVPPGEVTVGIGGAVTILRDAEVSSQAPIEDSEFVHGWLGMDLLSQGRSTTLDFRAMQVRIEGTAGTIAPIPTSSATAGRPAAGDVDAAEIVRRSLQYESLDMAPARDYVYLETKEQQKLDVNGRPTESTTETREVLNLYDQEYARLVKKDGKPLTGAKAHAEQARFDKAVEKRSHETPLDRAKREDARRKSDAEALTCQNEMTQVFTFRMAGETAVNGRPAWMIDAEPKPDAAPRCGMLKVLTRFHFRLWVDQQDSRWARWEGDNIAPVTVAKFLLRVPTGTMHWTFEQSRHEDGTWLDSRDEVTLSAKLLMLATVRLHVVYTYSDYRKFHTDSRMVPIGDQ